VRDISTIAARVSPSSTAALMVVEHACTTQLEQVVLAADGRIVVHERVPPAVATAALDYERASRASDRRGQACSDAG